MGILHIPDGYLSPATCAALYAGAAPFWYVALRKVKKELQTRTIPLLSLFSAFSFVVMMFNLPLPGGTTGHAVGMGIASIILGPWVSALAISIALLIQALFFGDGGITAYGANCFNMAIVGSLVAAGVYRLVSQRADVTSRRRIIAAALAGYTAINVAAFFAAVEFGIQPLFFTDAAGLPLYAPYPLAVSIPAMMIGHLTFAGLAELVLSAGVVAYLQRADPAMLQRTARGAPCTTLSEPGARPSRSFPSLRRLWLALSLGLILTPLGIVAVGSAWGEWHASDYSDPAARRDITRASRNHALPKQPPQGLARLSSIWTAPVSDYAPAFIRSRSFGYVFSGMLGVGLILVCSLLVTHFLLRPSAASDSRRRKTFLQSTIAGFLAVLEEAAYAEDLSRAKGFLQGLDPRVKLAGLGVFVLCAIATHRLWVLGGLFGITVALAVVSNIPVRLLATRVWVAVLAFTGVLALPALFFIQGQPLFRIPILGWTATVQGLTSAVFLTLRAETAATFCLLLVLSTPWNRLLRGLRFLGAPVVVVVIVETTYRFVFVLLQTANNMFESRSTRLVGRLDGSELRRFAAATVGVLLDKSLQFSVEVQAAMQARGFLGEPMLLDDLRMRQRDWFQLSAFLAVAASAIWLGR